MITIEIPIALLVFIILLVFIPPILIVIKSIVQTIMYDRQQQRGFETFKMMNKGKNNDTKETRD